MDVRAGVEGGDERFVLRDVREHAQFNLRVIRVHEQAAGGGDEKLPEGAAKPRADGDVL